MKSGLMLGVNPNAERQEEDFYAIEPNAMVLFLNKIKETGLKLNDSIWECACGNGDLSKVLIDAGYSVDSTDLIDRGYGEVLNFLLVDKFAKYKGDILTNPPFKLAEQFVEQGMELLHNGNKLLLFLKIQFLEGQRRKKLFKKYPPKYVYCYSARQLCAKNGEFEKYTSTTQFYAWYIWKKGYTGDTIIKWI